MTGIAKTKEDYKIILFSFLKDFKNTEIVEPCKIVFFDLFKKNNCHLFNFVKKELKSKSLLRLFEIIFSKKPNKTRIDEIRQFEKIKQIYPLIDDLGGTRNKKHLELGLPVQKSLDAYEKMNNLVFNLKFANQSGGSQDHQIKEVENFINICENHKQPYVCVLGGKYMVRKMKNFLKNIEIKYGKVYFEDETLTSLYLYE
jgi:hypothetical protein